MIVRRMMSLIAVFHLVTVPVLAADSPFVKQPPAKIIGRWDVKVTGPDGSYPSWFEVNLSGYRTLVGSYVGQFGSARPISKIDFDGEKIRFTVPPQWERRLSDVTLEGKLVGEVIKGETTNPEGQKLAWEARRAPLLKRVKMPEWSDPIVLFNGNDLNGWKPRSETMKNGWIVRDGVLINASPGNDLVSEQRFDDFKLKAEFRYPKGSNSGIYLRGRYEVQLEDNFGDEPDSHKIGGVYGYLTPASNAAKKPDEWQTVEITLVGRHVTIVLNGDPIIQNQAIPGITGGALDSDESKPGPILLQGDHGPVEFRHVSIRKAKY
jgi:hypothetical protein